MATGDELFRIGVARNAKMGHGMIAQCPIKRGTLIICESVLFSINKEKHSVAAMKKVYKQLSAKEKLEINSLQDNLNESKTLEGILASNALPMQDETNVALYRHISRINHSCAPNAHFSFSTATKQGLVYAVRDIDEGEEVLISYLGDLSLKASLRKKKLKRLFSFDCVCPVCSLSGEELHQSDQRRLLLAQGKAEFEKDIESPEDAINAILNRIDDALKEELLVELPFIYFDGFQLCELYGDLDNSVAWADESFRWFQTIEGEYSPSLDALRDSRKPRASKKRFVVFDDPPIID